jgi:hypothetical protein
LHCKAYQQISNAETLCNTATWDGCWPQLKKKWVVVQVVIETNSGAHLYQQISNADFLVLLLLLVFLLLLFIS